MKLKCGEHAERESETRPIFVCHHCGMPVCEEHGWVLLDNAFDSVEEPVSRSAMHCPECAAEYHPRGASKRRGWVVRRPPPPGYGPAVPQPQGSYPPQSAYPQPHVPYPPQPNPPQPYPRQPYPEQQAPQQPQPSTPQQQPPRAPGEP